MAAGLMIDRQRLGGMLPALCGSVDDPVAALALHVRYAPNMLVGMGAAVGVLVLWAVRGRDTWPRVCRSLACDLGMLLGMAVAMVAATRLRNMAGPTSLAAELTIMAAGMAAGMAAACRLIPQRPLRI